MPKLTISELSKTKVNTKFGEKEKWLVTFAEKPDKKLDSFIGKWNSDWKIGKSYNFSNDQFVKREYKGKTYWSIKAGENKIGLMADYTKKLDNLHERVEILEEGFVKLTNKINNFEKVFSTMNTDDKGENEEPENKDIDDSDIRVEEVPF